MTSDKYNILKQIGKGAFGTAHIVQHKETGERLVLKKVRLARQSAQERQASINELYLVSNLRHRNILQYKESWVESGCVVCQVVELAESGDLLCQVRLRAPGSLFFSEELLEECAVQLLSALAFLHEHHIVHRDVKSSNILITGDGQLKLADFGLATVLAEADGYQTDVVVGTPNYMCPDVLQGKPYGVETDIWGAACVLFELSALKTAFQALNMAGLVKKVAAGAVPPLPSCYSEQWKGLIRSMMTRDAAKRPSAKELLELPFLQAAAQRVEAKFGSTAPYIQLPLADLPPEIRKLELQFKQQEIDEEKRRKEARAKQKAALDKWAPKIGAQQQQEDIPKKPPPPPLKPHQPRVPLRQPQQQQQQQTHAASATASGAGAGRSSPAGRMAPPRKTLSCPKDRSTLASAPVHVSSTAAAAVATSAAAVAAAAPQSPRSPRSSSPLQSSPPSQPPSSSQPPALSHSPAKASAPPATSTTPSTSAAGAAKPKLPSRPPLSRINTTAAASSSSSSSVSKAKAPGPASPRTASAGGNTAGFPSSPRSPRGSPRTATGAVRTAASTIRPTSAPPDSPKRSKLAAASTSIASPSSLTMSTSASSSSQKATAPRAGGTVSAQARSASSVISDSVVSGPQQRRAATGRSTVVGAAARIAVGAGGGGSGGVGGGSGVGVVVESSTKARQGHEDVHESGAAGSGVVLDAAPCTSCISLAELSLEAAGAAAVASEAAAAVC